ncbi:MAG: hypothetical protein ABI977_21780 [Acidobacteriota bacterium]
MFNRHRSSIIVLLFVFAFFVSTRTGSTHEPITTKVMFNKEVIRILNRNCLACHAPGKIKADIPLTTYEEARPWAKAIKEEVLEKRMMPFQAVKGYGKFQHDYALPQRDVEQLVSWIEGGAPRGEAKEYPKAEIERLIKGDAWPLGQPDLILQPEKETKIEKDRTECVLLPANVKEGRWLSAIDFQPGNGSVIHSAEFFLERTNIPPNVRLTACGMAGEYLGSWVPGQVATRLPNGFARRIPARSRIVLKINYQGISEAAIDRSRLALYFAKDAPGGSIRNVVISPTATAIPANAENARVKTSLTLAEATEAVAIRPLLFPFAKSIEATAYRPDGSIEVLIVAKNYRYDWQPAYQFRQPVALPKGTRIEVTAYLDNSDNNRNNPNDPPTALQFAEPLCEVALTQENQLKSARLSPRKAQRRP